jgi:hypothetical protein
VSATRRYRHALALAAMMIAGCSERGPAEPTLNGTPTVSVSVSAEIGLQAATVFAFTAQASDPDGDTLTYSWDFGDQSTATGSAVTHLYQASGQFTARVNVSDGRNTVSGQALVTVKNLTGAWVDDPVTQGSCTSQLTLTLVQSGATLSGTMGSKHLTACPGTIEGFAPVTGSVRNASPPVRWTGRVRGPNFDDHFTAEVNREVSILSQITIGLCFTHPTTGVETCTSDYWVVDTLTRQ